MDGLGSRSTGAVPSVPRLYCTARLRYVELSSRLVLLDLAAGTYDIVDEIGALMWKQLLEDPADRDIAGVAHKYGVEPSVIATDLAEFAAAQQAAGRLQQEPCPTTPSIRLPRRRPTVWRALRERAGVERDVREGFADAYTKCTGSEADCAPPRVEVERLVRRFRTADGLYPSPEAPLDCLPRSLALTRFLRMAGWPAVHVIGVALDPFEAHAWVELDGSPLDESSTTLLRYGKIAEA